MTFLRLLLLGVISLSAAAATDMRRPNILWIFSEDLSPYMGCYGDPINAGHTPTIDKFAAQGVLFTRAFATAPVCSASRSAIITGVMRTTTGTHQHRSSRTTDGEVVPEELRIHLPEGMETLPELMRAAGYYTFNSGKDDYNFHYDRGDLYSTGNRDDYVPGMNGWQGNHAKHNLSITRQTWKSRPDKDQPWFGQIEIKGGKANSKWVREGEELADNDVPLPPYFPETPNHRKAWTQHYNAVRGADARVQTILDQLEADGEMENTIVFFFSDHGNNQSLRHKQFCYEGGVHIPLMVKGNHPAIGSSVVRDELVSALDITATTLSLGGAAMPDYLDGQDLFADSYQERSYMISARDRCDYTIDQIRTVRTDEYRYIRNGYLDRAMLQAQYRDNHPTVADLKKLHQAGKLSPYLDEHWFGPRPAEELYDLATDPHQIHNLANDVAFKTELVRHRAILDTWIQETGDQGQQQEAAVQLEATYDLWISKEIFSKAKVNPEYDQFR